MDDRLHAEVTARLARLREEYLAHLPQELAALQALGTELVAGDSQQKVIEELHQRLHKLAGSGGVFGLVTLSRQARDLEQQVKNWLTLSLVDETILQTFANDLAGLARTLENAELPAYFILPARQATLLSDSVCIWLVDDDRLLGQEVARQLESFNYKVRVFERLADADSAAAGESPDILLLDVLFDGAGENAGQMLARFNNLGALSCPLLFITGQNDFQSRVRASKLHADGYFLKPLDVPRLVNRIAQLVDKRRAPPQRVLIIDDDHDLVEHYRLVLMASGMEVSVLENVPELMEKIARFRPELILMDMHMPEFTGPELAGVIRQHENWAGVPIVYLSAETDFDKQVAAMDRGGDDFLIKPITDKQLVAAVRVRVERARQLDTQISRDSLTGLLKHASVKEAVDVEVLRSRRSGKPASVAMLDIDNFKDVNDNYGHAVGDVVISSVAMLLRQILRHSDIIGRYGGEEFVAVLPECDQQHARDLMENLRQRFSILNFSHAGTEFNCTITVGLASTANHPDCDGAGLLRLADDALYQAKRGGRNQVREA